MFLINSKGLKKVQVHFLGGKVTFHSHYLAWRANALDRQVICQVNQNKTLVPLVQCKQNLRAACLEGRDVARGSWGCPRPPFCKPYCNQTACKRYGKRNEILVSTVTDTSVWSPPLKYPGYATERASWKSTSSDYLSQWLATSLVKKITTYLFLRT